MKANGPKRMYASAAHASGGRKPSSFPAAATILGEGVSPAARAAARGSPPGSAADTASADAGRRAGSFSKQRRIARSTAGSISVMIVDGWVGLISRCNRTSSETVAALNAAFPVNISYRTKPREYRSLRIDSPLPENCSGAM